MLIYNFDKYMILIYTFERYIPKRCESTARCHARRELEKLGEGQPMHAHFKGNLKLITNKLLRCLSNVFCITQKFLIRSLLPFSWVLSSNLRFPFSKNLDIFFWDLFLPHDFTFNFCNLSLNTISATCHTWMHV